MIRERGWSQQQVCAVYLGDEMSKFKNADDLASFVRFLDPERQRQLMQWLSEWRKNPVYDFLRDQTGEWQEATVEVSRIFINRINEAVNHLLEKYNYRLDLLARDYEVQSHPEFAQKGYVDRRFFIAKREEDHFRLIDGAHRAFCLASEGNTTLRLVYPV
jgi:hypothetical protein